MTMERPEAVSHEGGEVFRADDWMRLDRALIVGSDAGTFYATGKDLTIGNMKAVSRCLMEDPARSVARIAEVSTKGLAPKNDPALMALAIASVFPDKETRLLAWGALPTVARIGTHLFHFMAYRKAITKKMTTSRMGRTAVARWYGDKDPQSLAYDVTKYQERDGVSHRDILRLYHPTPRSEAHNALYGYVVDEKLKDDVGDWVDDGMAPPSWFSYVAAVEHTKRATTEEEVVAWIEAYGLPRECVPTQWLNSRAVWEALARKMPIGAMIRNLPKMTAVGLFDDPEWEALAQKRLLDADLLKHGRIHPIQVLLAAHTYERGYGDRGSLKWTPNAAILKGLDAAFYLSFVAVEPTGKRILLCVDTSHSMTAHAYGGLSAREIGAAMAMVAMATEPHAEVIGFSGHLSDLPIRPGMTLSEVTDTVLSLDANTTHCRLPIENARNTRREYDAFVMYTDNETADGRWQKGYLPKTGSFHEELRLYRDIVAPAAFVAVALAANDIRLSDPEDTRSLDVAGFSADAPATISAFIGGME